jgi:hypothetical protein
MENFWDKMLLESVGPLVTAVVGTLIIGTFVERITRKAQERRADNQLRDERIRAQNELRLQLIGEMTETASALYMATQNFWRKKDIEKTDASELAKHRLELEQQYRASRITGEVIERRLEAYFSSTDPIRLWHAAMDLLTVRYFYLLGLATEELMRRNAGEEHTGLSVEQLSDQQLVLNTYRAKLKAGAQAVLQGSIRPWAA